MILTSVVISAALRVQQINCFPEEVRSTDRVVISLQLPDEGELPLNGTLFLSSGLDDRGDQESTGPLPLRLAPETDEDAQKGLVRYQAANDSSTFVVSIHHDDLGVAKKSFELNLELRRLSEKSGTRLTLGCYSSLVNNSLKTLPQSALAR